MRVISGTAKGIPLFSVPGSATRPTSDKVKEAIFSMIGPYFEGGKVLDLFAGTGALGIESLSRGIQNGVFIDIQSASIKTIHKNLEKSKLSEKALVYRNEALRALKALQKSKEKFDLVFLDPPYKVEDVHTYFLQLTEGGMLCNQATIVFEHDKQTKIQELPTTFTITREAIYGDTAVTIIHHEGETE